MNNNFWHAIDNIWMACINTDGSRTPKIGHSHLINAIEIEVRGDRVSQSRRIGVAHLFGFQNVQILLPSHDNYRVSTPLWPG